LRRQRRLASAHCRSCFESGCFDLDTTMFRAY
jgi:hypothetical protein